MPSYDYYCPTNGRTVEVIHGMSDRLDTWGELCDKAELDPGDTAADAPVERLVAAGIPIASDQTPAGPPPGACGNGGCGMCMN